MAIETVAAWLIANPEVIPAITSVGSSIYESLFPDEAKQIQLEVLEDQKNFRRMLSRQSRGIFTGSEREAIARGAEPTVNRIAGNVAARGLGGSGAGAQVVSAGTTGTFFGSTNRSHTGTLWREYTGIQNGESTYR